MGPEVRRPEEPICTTQKQPGTGTVAEWVQRHGFKTQQEAKHQTSVNGAHGNDTEQRRTFCDVEEQIQNEVTMSVRM